VVRRAAEFQQAVRRLGEQEQRLLEHEARLKGMGLARQDVDRAMEPLRSFHLGLQEEVEHYEKARRGELGTLTNLHRLGRALVDLRIALGLTQRELAERLGVHESQVSRDERNDYHGISVDRASRILDAMGASLTSRFEGLPARGSTSERGDGQGGAAPHGPRTLAKAARRRRRGNGK
jgi:transcriptional regulator with XRE-family HTH domain